MTLRSDDTGELTATDLGGSRPFENRTRASTSLQTGGAPPSLETDRRSGALNERALPMKEAALHAAEGPEVGAWPVASAANNGAGRGCVRS